MKLYPNQELYFFSALEFVEEEQMFFFLDSVGKIDYPSPVIRNKSVPHESGEILLPHLKWVSFGRKKTARNIPSFLKKTEKIERLMAEKFRLNVRVTCGAMCRDHVTAFYAHEKPWCIPVDEHYWNVELFRAVNIWKPGNNPNRVFLLPESTVFFADMYSIYFKD